jgi:hypothetical protein
MRSPGSVGLDNPNGTACEDLEIAKAAEKNMWNQAISLLAENCWDDLVKDIEAACKRENKCEPEPQPPPDCAGNP